MKDAMRLRAAAQYFEGRARTVKRPEMRERFATTALQMRENYNHRNAEGHA
jgi:hypothetical protein